MINAMLAGNIKSSVTLWSRMEAFYLDTFLQRQSFAFEASRFVSTVPITRVLLLRRNYLGPGIELRSQDNRRKAGRARA